MKKIYIQPIIDVEMMETESLLNPISGVVVESNEYDPLSGDDNPGEDGEGDGSDLGAKGFDFSADFATDIWN